MKKNGIELSHNDIIETEWKQKSHSKDRINAKKKKLCTVVGRNRKRKLYWPNWTQNIHLKEKKINFYWEFIKVDWYIPI